MKINWKRVNNHFKVFILGVVLTLGYRAYQQQRQQKKIMESPQRAEDDRPDSPGRTPYQEAEKVFLLGDDPFNANSPDAQSLSDSLGNYLENDLTMTPRVFCLQNGKRCVFLIKTERMVAEEEKQSMWGTAQKLAAKTIPGYPTVAIVFYRKDRYGSLFVGGRTGPQLFRKDGGPCTLYPYFEGANMELANRK